MSRHLEVCVTGLKESYVQYTISVAHAVGEVLFYLLVHDLKWDASACRYGSANYSNELHARVLCVYLQLRWYTYLWWGVGVSCGPAWQIVTWGLGSYYYDFSFRTHPTFIVILLSRPLNVPVKMSSLDVRVLEAGENGGTHDARSDLTIQPRKE